MNSYYTYDPDTKTVICHAFGFGSGSKKGSTWEKHKYIAKIGDRYIYTRDQLKAIGSRAKNKIDTAVYNGTQKALKTVRDKALDVGNSAAKKYIGLKTNRVIDKAERAFEKATEPLYGKKIAYANPKVAKMEEFKQQFEDTIKKGQALFWHLVAKASREIAIFTGKMSANMSLKKLQKNTIQTGRNFVKNILGF